MFLLHVKNIYQEIDNHFDWYREYNNNDEIKNQILNLDSSKVVQKLNSKFSKNLDIYLNEPIHSLSDDNAREYRDGYLVRKIFFQTVISLLQLKQRIPLYSTGAPRYRIFWLNFQSAWKNPQVSLESIVSSSIKKIKRRVYNRPGAEELLQEFFHNAWIRCQHFNENVKNEKLFKLFFKEYSIEIITELFNNQIVG